MDYPLLSWSVNPLTSCPMEAGIDQLLRYANRRTPEHNEGAEKLFHYNLMMVSTHRDKARVGTITSRMEHYLEWKDPYPSVLNKDLDLLIHRAPIEGWDYPRDALIPPSQPGTIENPTDQDVLFLGLFDTYCFLDILRNFTYSNLLMGASSRRYRVPAVPCCSQDH